MYSSLLLELSRYYMLSVFTHSTFIMYISHCSLYKPHFFCYLKYKILYQTVIMCLGNTLHKQV